jgi:hypothetical protein
MDVPKVRPVPKVCPLRDKEHPHILSAMPHSVKISARFLTEVKH